ncbi:hypothetical protein [Streptosporangium sp. NBC_01469]|uniref:hypothetical protein n=1 Tax=Streptosporangium sp. NBC_01469 TaxID=2903898 RepID=UPI002E297F06|nr:hypothetical protein [Streptosporangium sp. NBC_01469]
MDVVTKLGWDTALAASWLVAHERRHETPAVDAGVSAFLVLRGFGCGVPVL